MKTIPLKTLVDKISALPWNIYSGRIECEKALVASCTPNRGWNEPDAEEKANLDYIHHCCNHFPELVEALRVIADDCEELSRVDIVDKAESRAWKSIESRIRKALASAETVQIEE